MSNRVNASLVSKVLDRLYEDGYSDMSESGRINNTKAKARGLLWLCEMERHVCSRSGVEVMSHSDDSVRVHDLLLGFQAGIHQVI